MNPTYHKKLGWEKKKKMMIVFCIVQRVDRRRCSFSTKFPRAIKTIQDPFSGPLLLVLTGRRTYILLREYLYMRDVAEGNYYDVVLFKSFDL